MFLLQDNQDSIIQKIKYYSIVEEEDEILLPNMGFMVVSTVYEKDGIKFIDLMQEHPDGKKKASSFNIWQRPTNPQYSTHSSAWTMLPSDLS